MKVDLTYLKSLVGDDPEVIEEMLTIFCEDVPVYLETMTVSEQNNDWPTLAKTAHSLKSSVGFTGRNDLVEMAETLQHQKEKPTNPAIFETLTNFKKQTAEIVSAFHEMIKNKDY